MQNNHYCVIMAGGIGSRFWPRSRTNKPKQFLDITGTGETLLQQTFNRFKLIVPPENIFIVTNEVYRDLVLEQLKISFEQVILEPERKNTAPCIAYANKIIERRCPDAVIIVSPSDHLITKEHDFVSAIQRGMIFAQQNDALLTLGIAPTRPETGYGYIQASEAISPDKTGQIKKVKTFTEKPNLEMAKIFLESGNFYWNSGIFIWSLSSINAAFESYLPEVFIPFTFLSEPKGINYDSMAIRKAYSECPSISIDYGLMEKAQNVFVIKSAFGWSDLGTWNALYEQSSHDINRNFIRGENAFVYDSKNSIIQMPNDVVLIADGLDEMIVVFSDNGLLICKRNDEQRIKDFLEIVKSKKTSIL